MKLVKDVLHPNKLGNHHNTLHSCAMNKDSEEREGGGTMR